MLIHNSLVLPIAPAARGKSTLARQFAEAWGESSVVSNDTLRGVLCPSSPCTCVGGEECIGGESCQCQNDLVASIALGAVSLRLEKREGVFLDGTNLSEYTRKSMLRLAKKTSMRSTALVSKPISMEELLRRNAGRSRRVPEFVIEKMVRSHSAITPELLLREGFDDVQYFDDDTQIAFR